MIDNALDYEGLKHYNGKSKEYIDNSDALLKQTIGVSYISKNLIPFPYYDTRTEASGVTFSVDEYGRVTLNGTSTADIYFYLIDNKVFENALVLPNDNFILTGCPSGGSNSTYRLGIVKNVNGTRTAYKNDYGSGVTFPTVNDGNTRYDVTIYVAKGATLNNVVFEPMLRLASIKDSTFKPYIPSLKTLIDSNVKDVMVGASSTTDGKNGLVPAPNKGEQDKFLKGDGTWSEVNATTLNGKSLLNYDATDTWEGIPYISSNGIVEIGKIIDFHISDDNTNNYDVRIEATENGVNIGGKTTAILQSPVSMADGRGIVKQIIGLHNPISDINIPPDLNNSELTLTGRGNSFIGSGEAPYTIRNKLIENKSAGTANFADETSYMEDSEQAYICSDSHLWLYSNTETYEDRRCIVFNNYGNFYPFVNDSYSLGTPTYKWKDVNSVKINGYILTDACARGVKTLTTRGHSDIGTNNNYLIDSAFIGRWNGAHDSNNGSNLQFCCKGEFGDSVTRGVDTTPTDSSSNLITSGAMYSALASKLGKTESATSATKVYSTATTPTDNYYLIPFHSDNTSGDKSLLNTNGFTVRVKTGTTSANGYNCFIVGNEIESGVEGNKYGAINIYGTTKYRTQITSGAPTSNRNISLPDSAGTLSIDSSDIRLKDNIKDTEENALSVVNSIQFRQFDWKETGKHQKIGVIADELEEIDKHLVLKNTGGYYDYTDEDGNLVMNVKCVDTFYLMGYYGKAIQELSALVKEQAKEIKMLKDSLK